MNSTVGKSTHYYYITILSILSFVVVYGIYFYWSKGPVNIENINTIFNTSSKIDRIKKGGGIKPALTKVRKFQIGPAIKIIDNLQTETKSFGNDFEIDSYKILNSDLRSIRSRLKKLLSYPEMKSVFVVLLKKITSFEEFVVSRNWRTLTRISKRTRTKITIGRSTLHSSKRLKRLVQTVKKDIKMMNSLTKSSILSTADKTQVVSKLDALNIEVDMLGKYLSAVSKFNKDFKNVNSSFEIWVSELAPAISLKKIDFERHSQNFLFALVVFLSLILISLMVGVLVFKNSVKRSKEKTEKLILDVVKETLVPLKPKTQYTMSDNFTTELAKFREYLHKRMSFGSIFQDAMPFSSILLDSNLNMVWSNSLFCETWGIDSSEIKEGNITWDYIGQYTNLGVSDPIVNAIHDNIAGIYQIQVRPKDKKESIPYEMYVSPVSYADQNRVMIIFYPLRSMEETLKNQTQSLVGPISRTLDAFSSGAFDEEFKEKISNDFRIANIENIYDKFIVLDHLQSDERKSFTKNINDLENTNYDYRKTIDDITQIYEEEKKLHSVTRNNFINAKDSIVELISLRQSLEVHFNETLGEVEKLLSNKSNLLMLLRNAYEVIESSEHSMKDVDVLREELKEVKNSLDQSRSRIMAGIDAVRSKKHNENTITKLHDDFSMFEKYMRTFSKVLIGLDGSLKDSNQSELAYNYDELNSFHEDLLVQKEKLDKQAFQCQKLITEANLKDEGMVESLGSLFNSFEESRQKSLEVSPLLIN